MKSGIHLKRARNLPEFAVLEKIPCWTESATLCPKRSIFLVWGSFLHQCFEDATEGIFPDTMQVSNRRVALIFAQVLRFPIFQRFSTWEKFAWILPPSRYSANFFSIFFSLGFNIKIIFNSQWQSTLTFTNGILRQLQTRSQDLWDTMNMMLGWGKSIGKWECRWKIFSTVFEMKSL